MGSQLVSIKSILHNINYKTNEASKNIMRFCGIFGRFQHFDTSTGSACDMLVSFFFKILSVFANASIFWKILNLWTFEFLNLELIVPWFRLRSTSGCVLKILVIEIFQNLKRILFRHQIRQNFGFRNSSNFQIFKSLNLKLWTLNFSPLVSTTLNRRQFYGSTIKFSEKFEFGSSCISFKVSLLQKLSTDNFFFS